MDDSKLIKSGVILDNTTFIQASNILSPSKGDVYEDHFIPYQYRDIQDLANFIEALVLHDKIYLDPETLNLENPTIKEFIKKLSNIIDWQDYSFISREEIIRRCHELTMERGKQGVFFELIRQMPIRFWKEFYKREAKKGRDYGMLIYDGLSILNPTLKKDRDYVPLSEFQMYLPEGFKSDIENSMPSILENPVSTVLPIMALVIRGYFHLIYSIEAGIPYQPLIARAPFIQHELYYPETKRVCFRQILLREFEEIRATVSAEANEVLNARVFEVPLPLVLAYVLRKSKSADDILDRALELRESKNLVRYRNFCADIERRLLTEELNPLEVKKLKGELYSISYETCSSSLIERMSISIGIPPSISLGLPISVKKKKKGLLFLYDLQSVTQHLQSLEPEFIRLDLPV
jgi:hypothetical protein